MANPPGRPKIPPDAERCTARARQTGQQCRQYREGGTTVCRYHGARGIVARKAQIIARGQGRESRGLPLRLAERYQTLISDPDILNLTGDLALLDLRLEELTGRLEDGESVGGLRRARDAYTKLRSALAKGDGGAVGQAMASLDAILTSATAADNTWRDIREILLERRLLAETERRRLVDLHQMVTVEEMMLFVNALIQIINRHVPDQRTRTSIALEVRGLLGRQAATRSGRIPQHRQPTTVDATVTPA
jgi:hypothetical protein